MEISTGVEFVSGHGASVYLSENRTNLAECGIEGGFVFFEDVYLNPRNDLYLNISNGKTDIILEHDSGTVISEFSATSSVSRGKCAFQFGDLQGNTWYRLRLNGEIAEAKSGTAHGKTDDNGTLIFEDVIIKNE